MKSDIITLAIIDLAPLARQRGLAVSLNRLPLKLRVPSGWLTNDAPPVDSLIALCRKEVLNAVNEIELAALEFNETILNMAKEQAGAAGAHIKHKARQLADLQAAFNSRCRSIRQTAEQRFLQTAKKIHDSFFGSLFRGIAKMVTGLGQKMTAVIHEIDDETRKFTAKHQTMTNLLMVGIDLASLCGDAAMVLNPATAPVGLYLMLRKAVKLEQDVGVAVATPNELARKVRDGIAALETEKIHDSHAKRNQILRILIGRATQKMPDDAIPAIENNLNLWKRMANGNPAEVAKVKKASDELDSLVHHQPYSAIIQIDEVVKITEIGISLLAEGPGKATGVKIVQLAKKTFKATSKVLEIDKALGTAIAVFEQSREKLHKQQQRRPT